MKKIRDIIASPVSTVILFVVAAGLLLFSTIGGVRAAYIAYSETYGGQIKMYDIGVSLYERCQGDKDGARKVAYRNYIQNSQDKWDEHEGIGELVPVDMFLGEGSELIPGKSYKEELFVENSGTIDEYVRVSIYKYWLTPDGNKTSVGKNGKTTQDLSPAMIDLHLTNTDSWLEDKDARTDERIVVYYNKVLSAGESLEDVPLSDTLAIGAIYDNNGNIVESVTDNYVKTVSEDKKTITTTYTYDGWRFCLEARVDAVQSHNIKEGAKSVWGRDITVNSDGTISLD